MQRLAAVLIAIVALGVTTANAQTAAPPATTGTIKAVQPGLFEVAGPRVNDVISAGITKISATPGKGLRSIQVSSPWGDSYHGWPATMKQLPFTITVGKGGTAMISAPGFTEANKADYKAAIDAVVPFAINATQQNRNWSKGSGR